MKAWIIEKLTFVWDHRTKTIGILAAIGAGIENLCAQYGHEIPIQWRGVLLGVAGSITFCVGLYNTFKDA
jgi:hypothetical protein